jgi:hypothetical protein
LKLTVLPAQNGVLCGVLAPAGGVINGHGAPCGERQSGFGSKREVLWR